MNNGIKKSQVKIALTGGIGSGKSTALSMFAARGAQVLNSDHLVHRLLQRSDVLETISQELGIGEISANENGRDMLAQVVFNEPGKLDKLQGIIFPLVRDAVDSWLKTEKVSEAALAVVELPMLFEAEMTSMFDHVILITAPLSLRQLRYAGRISSDDFNRRAERQLPEEEKETHADLVYTNSGSWEELEAFIAHIVERLTA